MGKRNSIWNVKKNWERGWRILNEQFMQDKLYFCYSGLFGWKAFKKNWKRKLQAKNCLKWQPSCLTQVWIDHFFIHVNVIRTLHSYVFVTEISGAFLGAIVRDNTVFHEENSTFTWKTQRLEYLPYSCESDRGRIVFEALKHLLKCVTFIVEHSV